VQTKVIGDELLRGRNSGDG
jgi:integrase